MSKEKEKFSKNIMIKNRRAEHEYSFIQEYEAGIILSGTEIKSIRGGYANLNDSFCTIDNGELFVRNLHIAEYTNGTYSNHEAKRVRKLLLKKNELKKLDKKLREKGFTIIPFKLYINDRGFAKLAIELAQGKKSYDKREALKERDVKKDIAKIMKQYK